MTGQTYRGSCQCGAVTFDVEVDISRPVTCNCSRCQRLGSALAFTSPDSFHLLSGAAELAEYTFNRHVIRHQFCRICGIEPFATGSTHNGTPMVAINVNCLEGIDPRALPVRHFDGRAL